jgi:hypothetical protein
VPIDQRDRQATLGEVDRDGSANDAGSNHDDVGTRQKNLRYGSMLSYAHAAAELQAPTR